MIKVSPLIHDVSGEARKTAAGATSPLRRAARAASAFPSLCGNRLLKSHRNRRRLGAEINLLSFVRLMRNRGHKSAGSIRVRFLRFIVGFRDQTRLTIGDVTFDIDSCRIIRDGS